MDNSLLSFLRKAQVIRDMNERVDRKERIIFLLGLIPAFILCFQVTGNVTKKQLNMHVIDMQKRYYRNYTTGYLVLRCDGNSRFCISVHCHLYSETGFLVFLSKKFHEWKAECII